MLRCSFTVLIILIGQLSSFLSEADSSSNSPLSPIQKLKASLRRIRQTSLVIDETVKGNRSSGPYVADRHTTSNTCGEKKLISSEWVEPDALSDSHSRVEYLINPSGVMLSAQAFVDAEGNEVVPEDGGTTVSLVLSDVSLVAEGVPVRNEESVYKSLDGSAIPLGFYGFASLDDYLQGKIIQEKQTPEGYFIEIQSKLGTLLLTLDPKHNWLPLRVEVKKKSNHLVFDGPVKDFFIYNIPKSKVPIINESAQNESHPLIGEQMLWLAQTTAFAKSVDGTWYPSEIEATHESIFADGASWHTKSIISVHEIDNKTNKQCDFSFDIPVGLVVYVEKALQIPYKWDGTKAVPGVPDLPSGNEYDKSPQRGSNMSYIMWFNIIVLICIIAFVLIKYVFIPKLNKK
ncbi:hypothetical protein [Gimesia panareensis]|uniref:hypothetical protein n=1 Tax=Gimesia panareensis TaxID=2527978 RepID=UPI00118CED3A|nr:hypothetical protein [Gimesia panareensis]QDU52147.1 hypothetical protein Pan110_45190 [Gimesia panareensis]